MLNNPFTTEEDNAALTQLRQRLHSIPEMGFHEHKTSELICETLEAIGIPFERGIATTGIVATLTKGTGGSAIGFRADIDALPISEATNLDYRSTHEGVMHACGHDGHTTMLLGAARVLKNDVSFNGTIQFIFQPAEEHGKGALQMIEEGLFERFPVDAVYGLHNLPLIEAGKIALNSGPIMGAEDNFVITITGQGGHAAMPHSGRDTLTIGASIVTELQTIVSRNINPLHGAVVSCTEFITDGTTNVIPTTVTIKGDTRSFLPEVSKRIEDRINQIVKGVCTAHEVKFDVQYERVFTPTINTPAEAAISTKAGTGTVGASNVDENCLPLMGSEDFGAMLQQKPGCYAFIGCKGANGKGEAMLHNASYDFNDDIIPIGVAYWVNLAKHSFTKV